ncbi:GNAT family N-acetyltransferase [Halobacillus sp. Nhm2S1]|uniref:GNAT family N-acetyltransferase n=1 Tax=Halobacillus sp. Nhm2S1 TaxID=2866716 RepID=UPI001C72ABE8|nr:GNAT family N-acetyltransferase [Halobacillus sp. Nhm2S1]MBX0358610.1 GNAT family N-acetyltransferase [Halobacillus sp. Nhm2S1]
MVQFRTIDLRKDRQAIIDFRKDSFMVSFGNTEGFDVQAYLFYVLEKVERYPDGFVMAEVDGGVIGQLELSVKKYKGRKIGYIHLFYLIPRKRGEGIGKSLHNYAVDFFKKHNLEEYHLRVAPDNRQARRFYEKAGMETIGPELDGKVIRMKGSVTKTI